MNILIFVLLMVGLSLIVVGLFATFWGKDEGSRKNFGFAIMTIGFIVMTLELGDLTQWNWKFLGGALVSLLGLLLRK